MRRRRGWWARRVRRCRSPRWGRRAPLSLRPPRSCGRLTGGGAASSAPVIAPTSCSTVASAPRNWATPPAQAQHLDVVGHLEHLGHVVADQHHGDALVGDAAHELEHLAGLAHAEGGGGLVHEDHLVGPHHRTADRHALFWPPDSAPTGASRSFTSVPMRANASPACSRIALRSSTPRRPRIPGSQLASGDAFSAGPSSGASARSGTWSPSRARGPAVGSPARLLAVESDRPAVGTTAPERILTARSCRRRRRR